MCRLSGFNLILRANLFFSFNLWFIRCNFKRKGWRGTIVSWLNYFIKKSSLLMHMRQEQFESKKRGSSDFCWRKLKIYSFLFLVVAVLTKLFIFSQVQNLNQIFPMRNMISHSCEYFIVYFHFCNCCFFFNISKRHFVNQHILLKSHGQKI